MATDYSSLSAAQQTQIARAAATLQRFTQHGPAPENAAMDNVRVQRDLPRAQGMQQSQQRAPQSPQRDAAHTVRDMDQKAREVNPHVQAARDNASRSR